MKPNKENKYKRGDLSPCCKYRFWQYQAAINKKTNQRGERWILEPLYESYKADRDLKQELSKARSEWNKNKSNDQL